MENNRWLICKHCRGRIWRETTENKIISFQNWFYFKFQHKYADECLLSPFLPVFLPALLLSLLVFTGWYFSFTEATWAPRRYSWSNMSLTGLHTILLKQPFAALNIHWLERRSFHCHWKGCVRTSYELILHRGNLDKFCSWRNDTNTYKWGAPHAIWGESFVYLKWKCSESINGSTLKFINVQMIKCSRLQMMNHTLLHLLSVGV